MNAVVILTVVGSDRPGLTQRLADVVLSVGGNWLESHLARLAGKYVGSVLVEVPKDNLATLEKAIRDIDARGLSVTMVDAGPEVPAAPAGERISLDLIGQDRPGIVREITAVLAELGVNIEDFSSEVQVGSWSGEKLFRASASLQLPEQLPLDQLREALERISGEIMVDITLASR